MSAMLYLFESCNLVHRDIKPENILIFKKNVPFLSLDDYFYKSIQRENEITFKLCGISLSRFSQVDFGFSDNHGVCGTECRFLKLLFHQIDYTEPHVFRGEKKHTLQSDMWSLGIVAHFALFGTNPYYQLLKGESITSFMPTVLMKEECYNQLGPKLKRLYCCWY